MMYKFSGLAFLLCSIATIILATVISVNSTSTYSSLNRRQELATKFSDILEWKSLNSTAGPSLYETTWFQDKVEKSKIQQISEVVKKSGLFFNMNKNHIGAMKVMRNILLAEETLENVLKLAEAFRDHPEINSKLWQQAFISTKLLRKDMQFLHIPDLPLIAPGEFLPREIFEQVESIKFANEECLILDESFAVDNGAENALWYFREDLMLNAHHYYWHIYYEPNGFPGPGDRANRRGELFSFMHHEFLARYNTERMTVNLSRSGSLIFDYTTPLVPYMTHLSDINSARNYTDRPENITLSDFNAIPGFNINVQAQADLQVLIHNDVLSGSLISENGTLVELDGFNGIEILSDIVEPSVWSINPGRYAAPDGSSGGLHGNGHVLVAFAVDPEDITKFGIMMATSGSMRDPSFYQHHTAIENVYLEHKNMLTPYSPSGSEFPLKWESVRIESVQVLPEQEDLLPNTLQTFWNYKEYNYTRGLDHQRNVTSPPVAICAKHLDHVEFDYQINLESELTIPTNATAHIFLARRFDENSNRFTMEEQRSLFFLLDQFPITVFPGLSTVLRNSRNSSLTVPLETFLGDGSSEVLQYCGCGLPHYLLLPIGSTEGTTFDLFVMLTEGVLESQFQGVDDDTCGIAPIWCGVRDQEYPSRHPMGYPFDRRPYSLEDASGETRVVANLDEYIQQIPNMNAVQVNIKHTEEGKH